MIFIIGLQRLPIPFKTHYELRISENVNCASKHASFLRQSYYDKIICYHFICLIYVFFKFCLELWLKTNEEEEEEAKTAAAAATFTISNPWKRRHVQLLPNSKR